MMYRVDAGTLARRGFVIPPAALARAARSVVARRAVAALAGLGGPYDRINGTLAQDQLAYVNNGSFSTAADFKAALTGDVMGMCSQLQYFDQVNGSNDACPPDIASQIDAATQSYANWLAGQAYVPPPSFSTTGYAAAGYGFSAPPGYQVNPYTGALEQLPPNSIAPSQFTRPADAQSAIYQAATVDTGGGGTTAYTVPPTNASPVSTGGGNPTGGGGSTVAAATPVQATLQNQSRPNQPLQPGDAWALTITGQPNAPVSISGSQNGVNKGTTPFGTTDASGRKVISGQMTANEIGSWQETIAVGNGAPASLSFSVVAAPASPGPTGGGGSTTTGNTAAPGGSTTGGTTATTTAPAPPAASGISTNSLLLYGGIAVAAFLFLGGRR